jgi:hypothetical protein
VHGFFKSIAQFGCGNADNSYTLFPEPCVAAFVAGCPIGHVMADSVDLNSEPRGCTIEIENIRANRMLAAKNRLTWKACAQAIP